MTPKEAYDLAQEQGPSDETRKAVCREPGCAYLYARDVDEGPRDDTRKAACQDPEEAYWYAFVVDRGPHDVTRAGACLDTWWTHWYATYIDKCLHYEIIQALPPIELANLQEQLEFD